MKYLLAILLFVSCNAFGQGFGLASTSVCFCNSTTVTINSTTYTGGSTYIVFVATTAIGTPSDNPTISSGSLSLTKIGTVTGTNSRLIAYSFVPASTTTTNIVFTYAQAQRNQLFAVYSAGAASMTGYGAFSYVTNSGSGADPSITMSSSNPSHTIGYFFNDTNPFGGTAESGWTEDFDAGNGTPNGHAGYHRNATTDNTIQVTAAASNWIGIGIQYSQTRRIFIIN